MTDQLSLYKGACRVLGETTLTNLTENREPRYVFDEIWDDGFRQWCLEQGYWNFATRTGRVSYNPGITPGFGFIFAFDKPTDWVRTARLASDEYFLNPLTDRDYHDEGDYLYADLQTIYLSWVSNDASYGYDYAKWPQSFVKFAEAALAWMAVPRIKQSKTKREDVERVFLDAKRDALSKDAMNQGASFRPEGRWARARRSGYSRDRRARGRLIG